LVLGAPPAGIPVVVGPTTSTRTIPVSVSFTYVVIQPISNIDVDSWTDQVPGPATYADIAESVPDDSTWILSPAGLTTGTSAPAIFGLPAMTDPGAGGALVLIARTGPPVSGTTTASLQVDLLDASATQVGTHTLVVPTSALDYLHFNFTVAETDAYRAGNGFSTGGRLRFSAVAP